ncbi:Predicted transporter component [Thermoproteus uzoniensis 768-20]|uniref:Predicted transporter component n=1 Tax=Thermoproteus uzoniensis (strain 768-20) TaxID=999630 RepID=F2L2G5_THEU7|nr:YeeE/YedE thiosulfate transporter family protein [Thermoproteus uzoniensis]AEA11830.1 Predicted transporter component [Thermoproteus uzoniensis 768-20]
MANIQDPQYLKDMRTLHLTAWLLLLLSLAMLFGGIYMQVVLHQTKAPLWLGIVAALPLAIPLELWNFSDPDTLFRVMALQDRFLIACFGFAIGLGAILLYGLNLFTAPNFGLKAFFVGGVVLGGLIFGVGVGLAGYFPGTVWIALGQGRRDALYAVLGGLLGAFTWSVIFGWVKPYLWDALNFGTITWPQLFGIPFSDKAAMFASAVIFGIIMFLVFLFLPRFPKQPVRQACGFHLAGKGGAVRYEDVIREEKAKYPRQNKYLVELINESSIRNARYVVVLGLAFTIEAVAVIILRQIFGESTTYSWIGAQLSYMVNPYWAASNPYFQLFGGMHIVNGVPVDKPFSEIGWEPITDLSTFLGGLISSVFISRRFMGFKRQIPRIWAHRFGESEAKRFLGSFFGAFLVLFGARMANGCASGHILSGNIQMAVSSFVFMLAVMAGAVITLRYVMRLRINSWGYAE